MRGEAAGEWTGSGAQALGLDGSAAGATRQGRVGAPVASAAGSGGDDRAPVHVLAPRRHRTVGQGSTPGRIGQSNPGAHRCLAGPAGDRGARTQVRDSWRPGRPAAAGAARPPRRAAVLTRTLLATEQALLASVVQAPSSGRGRRSERGRHRRSARPLPLALTVLPTLTFVGLVTVDRVLQTRSEDLIDAHRIAQLRGFYFDHAPELAAYLLNPPPERRLIIQGLPEGPWQHFVTIAGMVSVITSVLAGAPRRCRSPSYRTIPWRVRSSSVVWSRSPCWPPRCATRSLRWLSCASCASGNLEALAQPFLVAPCLPTGTHLLPTRSLLLGRTPIATPEQRRGWDSNPRDPKGPPVSRPEWLDPKSAAYMICLRT